MIKKLIQHSMLATPLALALVGIAPAVNAMPPPEDGRGITRQQVRNFAEFLDRHPMINRDLRKHPGLANDPGYLARHPELRTFLNNHHGVREEVNKDPRAFMGRERRS